MYSKVYKLICLLSISVSYATNSHVRVYDGNSHGIYMRDYCPETKYCGEGMHVVCMHNPDITNGMGPNCHYAKNISTTAQLAKIILGVTNLIRKNIASGIETGKDGQLLPQGYGLWRLDWDEDLATFAQVLANQCTLKHDMCRTTKKFEDPGQTVGMMRFHYPSWAPIKIDENHTELPKGLSEELVEYAVLNIIKKWYKQKKTVTPELIYNFQETDTDKDNGNLYLQMVYGPATHMGCGVSAYTDYVFNLQKADFLYNVIQLVCNFSGKPRPGEAIYNTTVPSPEDHTISGCPVGQAEEDENGLCFPSKNDSETTDHCSMNPDKCKKKLPIVILPIFTVEDGYPPAKNRNKHIKVDVGTRNVHSNTDALENYKFNRIKENRQKNEVVRKRYNVPIRKNSKLYQNNEAEENPSFANNDAELRNNWKKQNNRLHHSSQSSKEERERDLFTLLDDLEEEVKHVNLNTAEKELIDAKITKIYTHLRKTKNSHYTTNRGFKDINKRPVLKANLVLPNYNRRKSLKTSNSNKNSYKSNKELSLLRRLYYADKLDKFNNKKATENSSIRNNDRRYQLSRPTLSNPSSLKMSQRLKT